jgi:hypothetical protein
VAQLRIDGLLEMISFMHCPKVASVISESAFLVEILVR